MKKTEIIVILIVTISYSIYALFVSEIIHITDGKLEFAPSDNSFLMIGAFVAFYNMFWNIYRSIKDKFIADTLEISATSRINGNEIEINCFFTNKSENPISIDFCNIKGFDVDFNSIKLESNQNIVTTFNAIKRPEEQFKRKKKKVIFSYKKLNKLEKYINKSIKINIDV